MGCTLRTFRRVACLAVAANHLAFAAGQYCYYPSGSEAERAYDQFPCNEHVYTTLCCPLGWTCFSNNLCIATDPSITSSYPVGTAIRGTCTNPLWDTDACGDFCRHDPVDSNNGSVIACGNGNFCCQPDSTSGVCDCSTGKGTFQLPDGTAQTVIGVNGLTHTSTGTVIPSSTSASSPTSSTTQHSSSSTTPSSTGSISSLANSSSSISTPTSSSISTSSSAPSQTAATSIPVTQKVAFKAGVGTAGGLVSIFIIFLIYWFVVRPRLNRHGSQQSHEPIAQWAENAIASPHPMAMPVPHPYEEAHNLSARNVNGMGGLGAGEAGAAGAAGAGAMYGTQTPRPFENIDDAHNPYSPNYRHGGR